MELQTVPEVLFYHEWIYEDDIAIVSVQDVDGCPDMAVVDKFGKIGVECLAMAVIFSKDKNNSIRSYWNNLAKN